HQHIPALLNKYSLHLEKIVYCNFRLSFKKSFKSSAVHLIGRGPNRLTNHLSSSSSIASVIMTSSSSTSPFSSSSSFLTRSEVGSHDPSGRARSSASPWANRHVSPWLHGLLELRK
ncbi:hypothetical protein Leryth_024611, partial [Lithospermum erythrorhizon]